MLDLLMTRRVGTGLLIGLILVGLWLRLPGLWANTFHADEALFASWARLIGVWRDPLLHTQAVDKPPLLFYAQALFYPLLATPAGWPARMPNLIAGILLIPLTGRLAWQFYRQWGVALVAATLVCFSPLAVQFSATAFIDPLLTVFVVGAVNKVAVRPDPGGHKKVAIGAGFLFGLALLTKYQALLFLPLVIAVGWWCGWRRPEWAGWITGFVPLLVLFLAWTVMRSDSAALWLSQWQNIGGLRLVHSWELLPRLGQWGRLLQTVGGTLVGLLLVSVLLLFLPAGREKTQDQTLDKLLLFFVLAYLALHWLLSIPVWDRYLLPLVPFLAVLVGRLVIRVVDWMPRLSRPGRVLVPVGLALLMLPGAQAARQGDWGVGGRPGADNGAAEIAAFLQDAPYGTVLYDHWYSWQWRFYFFDRGVFVNWFPHPAGLADDLRVFGDQEGDRYLVLPPGDPSLPILRMVAEEGFGLEPVFAAEGMTLYRIERP